MRGANTTMISFRIIDATSADAAQPLASALSVLAEDVEVVLNSKHRIG